jgi:hypothetical protein
LYECETWSLSLTEHRLREQDLRYERSNEGNIWAREGEREGGIGGLRNLYNGECGDFVLVTEYYLGDPINVNGMNATCRCEKK